MQLHWLLYHSIAFWYACLRCEPQPVTMLDLVCNAHKHIFFDMHAYGDETLQTVTDCPSGHASGCLSFILHMTISQPLHSVGCPSIWKKQCTPPGNRTHMPTAITLHAVAYCQTTGHHAHGKVTRVTRSTAEVASVKCYMLDLSTSGINLMIQHCMLPLSSTKYMQSGVWHTYTSRQSSAWQVMSNPQLLEAKRHIGMPWPATKTGCISKLASTGL